MFLIYHLSKQDVERFPLLALVYKLRGTVEIFQVIENHPIYQLVF